MEIIKLLIEKNITISTAESCTGGLIANHITEFSGVSTIYAGSIVAYSNDIKAKLLFVDKEIFENYGAVSKECVRAMCDGGSRVFASDIVVSVSGVAGPGGGSKFNPVGSVIIGIKYHDKYNIERNNFTGNRKEIQQKAKNRALELIEEMILKKF